MHHHPYRADIDGLRAVAVLAVVAFHAGWVGGGFVGVDVFFVISGYLISRMIFLDWSAPGFVGRFYAGRIRRIFPALIVVLSACIGLGQFVLLPTELKGLGKQIFGGATFLSNFVLAREADYFDVAADLKPLLHLWSLGIEEQFYLIWPAFIIFAMRRRWSVGHVILVLALSSLALNVAFIQSRPVFTFYWPLTRLWELLAGAAVARFELAAKVRNPTAASIVGALLILAAVCTFHRSMEYPGWLAIVPVVGTALLIASGGAATVNRLLLSRQPLVFIGLISYPLLPSTGFFSHASRSCSLG
ncbi:acyltransferase family protein [Bradyrhizobium sp. CCBAU 53415]|uniref:acyltransferase family protein n=1 Tax=Bradyrhizobium sp. CCBAU 53415 TaxID=1325119 RepID=UPI002304F16B|nr:acyltransferase [Bradyrhizobium sp. CCBAU 53415]